MRFQQLDQARHSIASQSPEYARRLLTDIGTGSKELSGPPLDRLPLIKRAFPAPAKGQHSRHQAEPQCHDSDKQTPFQARSSLCQGRPSACVSNPAKPNPAAPRLRLRNRDPGARKRLASARLRLTAPARVQDPGTPTTCSAAGRTADSPLLRAAVRASSWRKVANASSGQLFRYMSYFR